MTCISKLGSITGLINSYHKFILEYSAFFV